LPGSNKATLQIFPVFEVVEKKSDFFLDFASVFLYYCAVLVKMRYTRFANHIKLDGSARTLIAE
jgi:hypothetical protein